MNTKDKEEVSMLKKVLGVALVLAGFSVSAFAAIPRDQMHIGNLRIGMNVQQVASVYGTPGKAPGDFKASRGLYNIAGGAISGWVKDGTQIFNVYEVNQNMPGADKVTASGGTYVGMSEAEIVAKLGRPDQNVDPAYPMYIYLASEEAPFAKRPRMIFTVNKGRVVSILLRQDEF